ncbi:MAG: hypothetical protein HKN51_00940 [Saprospiraceae bacterium]|nr:hypothetical protein [Saprospiraceae bacterium]
MIYMLKNISILICVVFFSFSLNAQNYDLEINVFVPPPYPTELDVYVDKMEQGIITVTNLTSEPVEAFFGVSLTENSGKFAITTNGILTQGVTVSQGATMLTPSDIRDIFTGFSESDINTAGLSPAQKDAFLLNKQLPEGSYTLCVFAFDNRPVLISDPEGNACFDFDIVYPERPIIDIPFNDEVLDTLNIFNILWSHELSDQNALSRTEYVITIIDLTEQEISNVQNAFLDPGISPDFEEDVGPLRFKTIQDDVELPLITGNKYAVRVTAKDPMEIIAYKFGGHSEIVEFFYGSVETKAADEKPKLAAPEIIIPADGKDLPVSDIINIQWDHTIEDTTDFSYTLKIIDKTVEKLTATIIKPDDLENDNYNYILDTKITSKDTSFTADSTLWIKDHFYAVAIKAESSDTNFVLENSGYSKVSGFKFGKTVVVEKEDNCSDEFISQIPDNTTSVKLKKNKEYKFGQLKLDSGTGFTGNEVSGYEGKGYITVKLGEKKIKVIVSYKDLKVNKDKEVFAGTAKVENDANVNLDEKIANYISGNSDLPFDEVAGFTTYTRLRTKIELANNGKQVALPLGIDRKIGQENMVIGISAMDISLTRASLTALFSIENPEWGDNIPTLAATGVCFNSDGLSNTAKLSLIKDYTIPLSNETLTLKAAKSDNKEEIEGTFASFGKDGFEKGQITGEIKIPREILVPEEENGEVKETGRATLFLSGTFMSKKNFLLEASLTSCQIPGLEGFSFQLKKGSYDNSDEVNPSGIDFPQGYEASEADAKWKGVWFSNAEIKAPQGWGFADDGKRTSINLKNFIKDKVGVSIKGEASQSIKGELEGFAISLDKISLDIIRNQFKSIKIEGNLGLPILPKDRPLEYVGMVDKDLMKENIDKKENALSMSFTIKPNKEGYDIDWLKAHVDFDRNTQFFIKNDAKEKGLKGTMGGLISIKTSDSDETSLELPKLKFEGMELRKLTPKNKETNENDKKEDKKSFVFIAPKFSLEGLPDNSEQKTEESSNNPDTKKDEKKKVNGFSFELKKLEFADDAQLIENGSELALNIAAKVMLVGESNKKDKSGKKAKNENGYAISAEGEITLKSKVSLDESIATNAPLEKLRFSAPSISVKKMAIDTEVKSLKLAGSVEFVSGDATYGKGAAGKLKVETPLTSVNLDARFGTKDDFNYWCAYGSVGRVGNSGNKPAGPLYPTPKTPNPGILQLWGFRGGAYYHMRDEGQDANDKNVTLSRYVPDKSKDLGLKAGVTIALDKKKMGSTKKEVFWANPELGIEIGDGTKVTLEGSGYMLKDDMTPNGETIDGIEFRMINTKARPTAFNIKGDKWDLQANMDVFVNMEGGIMKGGYDGLKMVEASLKVSEQENYVKLGTPKKPGKATFSIPNTEISITPSAYLMAGYQTTLPKAELDPFIGGMFKKSNSGFSGAASGSQVSTRTNGQTGFAFGAKLDYSLNLRAAILYADFRAMAGFDLSLISQDIACVGLGKKGLDGWYAEGKVYAGFKGDMGLYVDIFFYEGKISLLTLQAALLLEGGLPNPVYAHGKASMSYRVLGGLVSGTTQFDVKIGEKCIPIEEDDLGLDDDFIAAMYPRDQQKDASVFSKPMVSFNGKIGTNKTTINDLNQIYQVKIPKSKVATNPDGSVKVVENKNAGQVRTFRVKIKFFKYTDENSELIKGKGEILDDVEYKYTITKMLSPEATHNFEIVLVADEYVDGNWIPFKKNSGDLWELKRSHSFLTGQRPDRITYDNVDFLYPMSRQSTYLQDENSAKEGFVEFGVPIDYLFESRTEGDGQWKSKIEARFIVDRPSTFLKASSNDWNRKANKEVFYAVEPKLGKGKFLVFDMPSGENALPNASIIRINIVRSFEKNPDFKGDKLKAVQVEEYNATINIEGKDYQNFPPDPPKDKFLYQMVFRTSKYNNLEEKLADQSKAKATLIKPRNYSYHAVSFNTPTDEKFSDYDLYGKALSRDFKHLLYINQIRRTGLTSSLQYFFETENNFFKNYKKVFKEDKGFELEKLRIASAIEFADNFLKWKWSSGSDLKFLYKIWKEYYEDRVHDCPVYPTRWNGLVASDFYNAAYHADQLKPILETVNYSLKTGEAKDRYRMLDYKKKILEDYYERPGKQFGPKYYNKAYKVKFQYRSPAVEGKNSGKPNRRYVNGKTIVIDYGALNNYN